MRVAELLYTYEKYGVEILGVAVTVLLVMQCVQLFRVHKLRKQLNQMAGRQQLKDEMERMGRRASVGKENAGGQAHFGEEARGQVRFAEDVGRGCSEEAAGRRGPSGKNAGEQEDSGERERGGYALSENQSQLISEVLGEIFP